MLLFIVTFRFWLLVVAIVASVILFSYFYKKWEERRLRREVLNILSYLPLTDTENDFDFDSDNTMYVPLHDIGYIKGRTTTTSNNNSSGIKFDDGLIT